MREIPVNVTLLHGLVEATKRVTPRGPEDGDYLHRLVTLGEQMLGQQPPPQSR